MNVKPLVPLVLAVALAGCSLNAQVQAPSATAAAVQAAPAGASLPFKTVAFDSPGSGRYFKAGDSETVVLRSKADLDAFLGRHQPAVAPQFASPQPTASFGPPSSIPFGTQPSFQPDPIPDELKDLDFNKYTALAMFEGNAKVGTTERLVAVQEDGGDLVATPWRWDPPPNPAAIADVNGRLHVIAMPRTEKPVRFLPAVAKDGTSTNGGYGVGGNPTMNPKWPAVPNPDLSKELLEQSARAGIHGQVDSFEFKQAPVSSFSQEQIGTAPFTPDSLIWYVHATGTLEGFGPEMHGIGLSVGGAPTTFSEMEQLISPEDGRVLMAASKHPTTHPGFTFDLQPMGDLHLGDTLRFTTSGQPVEGKLTLTLSSGSATPLVQEIAYQDLPAFTLVLDQAHVPFLTGAALQILHVELKFGNGTSSRDVRVLKDADAKPEPSQRIQGPGTLAEYHPQAGETAADAFVRGIAAEDFQGTGLTYTNRTGTLAELQPVPREAVDLDPKTPIRTYTVRGTFPTFVIPANISSTGQDEVMAPTYLEVAVTEALPIRRVSLKAFK